MIPCTSIKKYQKINTLFKLILKQGEEKYFIVFLMNKKNKQVLDKLDRNKFNIIYTKSKNKYILDFLMK